MVICSIFSANYFASGGSCFSRIYTIYLYCLRWGNCSSPFASNSKIVAGLYFHIPFCKRICAYCDFYRSADLSLIDDVLTAMSAELEEQRDFLHDKKIDTIYFGGGTPSLLEPCLMGALIEQAARLFDCSDVVEITAEVNSDDITPKYVKGLRDVGFNRISIGVQSFDDEELRFMNRRHSAVGAELAVKMLHAGGFENITLDLIFGVDGFGERVLQHSIEKALELDVQHISAYHLTIEPATAFGRRLARGKIKEVAESQSEKEYALIESMLCSAGFEHYEVSNYARPGYRSKHNSSYWRQVEYLGVGPGAHSYNGQERHWSEQALREYVAGREYKSEILSAVDRRNEYIMTLLRCAEGIDVQDFEAKFGRGESQVLRELASRWVESGDLVWENNRLYIPTSRFLISDAVIESLFDA